jgi:hypothetical protein
MKATTCQTKVLEKRSNVLCPPHFCRPIGRREAIPDIQNKRISKMDSMVGIMPWWIRQKRQFSGVVWVRESSISYHEDTKTRKCGVEVKEGRCDDWARRGDGEVLRPKSRRPARTKRAGDWPALWRRLSSHCEVTASDYAARFRRHTLIPNQLPAPSSDHTIIVAGSGIV